MSEKEIMEPMFCGHANEVPNKCKCPPNCYCQFHTCKNRVKEPTNSPDGGNSLNDSDPKPEASMTEESAGKILSSDEHNHEFETCPECEQAQGYLERVGQENEEIKWRKYNREEDKARIEDLKELIKIRTRLLIAEREKVRIMGEALSKIAKQEHMKGCDEGDHNQYMGYCNCPDDIAKETLFIIKELK